MTETDSYYYYTPSFTEEDRESLKDLFGRDLFGKGYSSTVKELTEEQIDRITSRLMPKARSSLRTSDLLPALRKLKALTDTEFSHLRSGSLEPQEQAIRLMEYLSYKGSYGIAALYLSLLSSSDMKGGLPAHYQLAGELRNMVQAEYGVCEDAPSGSDSPVLRTATQTQSLRAAIKKLQGITVPLSAADILASHLTLPSNQRVSTDLCALCQAWRDSHSTCDLVELVEAMVITQGVGRYTSRLCSPTSVPPRDLRSNFLQTLGERWVELATYLGFSEDEIAAIIENYPDSVGKQVDSFLEKWKMPDCGQKTLPLMHKLKGLAGIVEPKRDTDGRRPRIDDSGVPPRRLDSYPHSTRSAPSSYGSPSQPHTHSTSHYDRTDSHSHSHHQHHTNGSFREDSKHEHYCPVHGSYSCSGQGTTRMRILVLSGIPGEEEDMMRTGQHGSYRTHSSGSHSLRDQDPVIEELSSDSSQPRSKPERRIMGNEITVPDQPSRSLSSTPRSSDLPKSTPRAKTAVGETVSSKTKSNELLGNEVLTERASSLDSSRERGGGSGNSLPFGNEVFSPNRAGGSLLGNEVLPGARDHGGSGRGDGEVAGEKRGKGGKDRGAGKTRGEEFLGNEVSMTSGRGSQFLGNEVSSPHPLSVGGSLGNEVSLPATSRSSSRVSNGGLPDNEVSVQPPFSLGSRGWHQTGRDPSRKLLGNEVESDSGCTTSASGRVDPGTASLPTASSHTARKHLKSDSSGDSDSHSFKLSASPSNLEVRAPLENVGVRRGVVASTESRSSSPDNDLSSPDGNPPLPSMSLSGGLQNETSSSVQSSNHLSAAMTQPPPAPRAVAPPPSVTQSLPQSTVTMPSHHSDAQSLPAIAQMPGDEVALTSKSPTNETNQSLEEEEENNFDDEDDDTGVPEPVPPQQPSPVRQFTIPLNEPSLHPDNSVPAASESGNGGEEVDNDLSVPTPETGQSRTLSQPVFMQTSTDYTLPPDNEAAVAGGDPSLSLSSLPNDLSTNEEVEPTEEMAYQFPPTEVGNEKEVKELCSEDVLRAIKERDGMEMLTALVESGANINLPTADGSYPIHVAVASGHHDTVLFLLNKEANVKERRTDGMTPLHVACQRQDFQMAQILVEKGASVSTEDRQGYTCLHLKETLQSLTIVKYLVHKGGPVDTPSHESHLTPLMMCCCAGNDTYETAHFLITKGANVDGCPLADMKPLIIACAEGYEKLVDLLLENNADVNILDHDANSALIKACQHGYVSISRKLCERRSDSNSTGANVNHTNHEGLTPLFAAVSSNKTDLVETLVTHGATVNCCKLQKLSVRDREMTLEMTPLASAAAQGNIAMVELLVENRADVNSASTTAMAPIAFAAMCGKVAVVEHFIKLNDLDVSLKAISQPFIEAVKARQRECAEILAERYGGLDRMLGDAATNSMEELADSVTQLQHLQQQPAATEAMTPAPPSVLTPPPPPQSLAHATPPQHPVPTLPQSASPFTNTLLPQPQQQAREGIGSGLARDMAGGEDMNNLDEDEENNFDEDDQVATPQTSVQTVPQGNLVNRFSPPPVQENFMQGQELSPSPVPDGASVIHEVATGGDASQDAEDQNNLDSDGETENDLSSSLGPQTPGVQLVVPQPTPEAEVSSQPPHWHTTPQSTPSLEPSLSLGNVVHLPPPQLSPMPQSHKHSTMPAFRASVARTPGTDGPVPAPVPVPVHETDVEELNQLDDDQEQQNNLSDPESSNDHGADFPDVTQLVSNTTPRPPQSSPHAPEQQLQTREVNEVATSPAPMSAPARLGPGSDPRGALPRRYTAQLPGVPQYSDRPPGTPLRASVEDRPFTSLPPSGSGSESLFAPRPKSPPAPAPSPPPPVVPQNIPSTMVDTPTGGLQHNSVEVLHDFAQICMLAAVRTKGQEWLINKATKTGYEHLTQFFLQYFHEGVALSMGGKLVSEFIGGTPSPLNFLLAGRFISRRDFETVAGELGQPDFADKLAMALHQFPGSDHLPYTGSEMADALFNQSFSIGHNYPDPSSLRSSSPPLQPAFPGQGHRLGTNSDEDFQTQAAIQSSLADHGGGSTSRAQLSSISESNFASMHPHSTAPSQSLPPSTAPRNTQPQHSAPSQPSSSLPLQNNFVPTSLQTPPDQHSPSPVQLSSKSNATSEQRAQPPAAEDGNGLGASGNHDAAPRAVLPSTGGAALTLTTENVFDEEEEELNDLSTLDDDNSGALNFVPMTSTEDGQLLGNEIEVKPVNLSRPKTQINPPSSAPTSTATPSSLAPSPPNTSDHTAHVAAATTASTTTVLPPSPSAEQTPQAPSVLFSKDGDVQRSAFAQPMPQPAAEHRTSPTLTKVEDVVETYPPSLTPSPEPTLPKEMLRDTHGVPHSSTVPVQSRADDVLDKQEFSPNSSASFPSPQLSPVSTHPPVIEDTHEVPSAALSVDKPSKPVTRPLLSGSSSSRDSSKAKTSTSQRGKDVSTSKSPRGTGIGRGKTVTTASGSRTKTGSVSKPQATVAAGVKKRAELGSAMRPRGPVSQSKPVSSRTSSKVATPATQPPRLRPQLPSKSSPLQSRAGSTESLHSKPSGKKLSSSVGSKPPSSHGKANGVKSKLGRAGRVVTEASPHSAVSRGLPDKRLGVKGSGKQSEVPASSLTDEEADSEDKTAPFKSLEPAPYDTESGAKSVETSVSVHIGISFPDVVIHNPESCAVFQVLAHRVRKWKILGRYLGMSDVELDEIESSNHFTTERCLKMLIQWGKKHRGKYSELEASLRNIMREDLIEDLRPHLPPDCSPIEEENKHQLKFLGLSIEGGKPNIPELSKALSQFVRKHRNDNYEILLHFCHTKLHTPIEFFLASSAGSGGNACDLTVLEELCFAAWMRSVSVVDLTFEIK